MREILFRGKAPNGAWVEGWFCGQVNESFFSPAKPSAQIITKDVLNWIKVIPKTVGQFTGLLDTNGAKIFEGDIIAYVNCCGDVVTGTVRYGSPTWYKNGRTLFDPEFCIDWDNGNDHGLMTHSMSWWAPKIEVIGNIWDNKCEAKK